MKLRALRCRADSGGKEGLGPHAEAIIRLSEACGGVTCCAGVLDTVRTASRKNVNQYQMSAIGTPCAGAPTLHYR